MSKLTPFGVALRKLRVEKGLRLFDLAEKLGKSTALISAIETGRKPVPDGFIRELLRALDLTSDEIRELRSGKEKTLDEVNVSRLDGSQRELVSAFARRLDEVPPDVLEQVRNIVLKSLENEVPFRRKRKGILVPPMSKSDIESLASRVRNLFCPDSMAQVPIVDILDFHLEKLIPEFDFQVWEKAEMGEDEGRVIPGKNQLILRRDVYDGACRNETRARFTCCHELGHYAMHHQVTFSRMREDSDPVYRDAEWQADSFAGYFMMSRAQALTFKNVDEAAARCGMSAQAAAVALSKYNS